MAKSENGDEDLEETIKLLGLVRKGKVCPYALGFKGTTVESLILKKKKLSGSDLSTARKGGRTVVSGLVSGQGGNVTFFVAKSDGYTELPAGGKPEKLKAFLNELTEANKQKWTPSYELVDEPPPVPFDEDDLKHPLVARFVQLQDAAMKVLDAQPQREEEIGRRIKEIRALLQDEAAIDSASQPIDELSELLKQWLSASPTTDDAEQGQPTGTTTETTTETQPTRSPEEQAQKLAESLKKLKTLAEKVIDQQPTRKSELFTVIARIAGQIKTKEFGQASQELVAFGRLLQEALAGSTTGGPNFDELQRWTERRNTLEPQLLEAQRADPDRAAKIGTLWAYAVKQAEANQYANAHKALDGLTNAIQEILSEQQATPRTDAEKLGIQAGLVAERVGQLENYFVKQLAALRTKGLGDIDRLGGAMQTLIPEDADSFHEAIVDRLEALFDEIREDLLQTVQTGLSAEILAAIARWRAEVAQDELIQHLTKSKQALQVETTIAQRFEELFQEATAEVERAGVAV